ncbi:MAG TPA: zinc ribbon domain-containing protein [Anaeromyxobacter sp.]|nr:zinc ribbon domain-containing protein [Anaeromyxobacter sp.]
MPIYEYACAACGKVFEELIVRRSDEAEVACPGCGRREVARQMSRPADTRGGGGGEPRRPARACGPIG